MNGKWFVGALICTVVGTTSLGLARVAAAAIAIESEAVQTAVLDPAHWDTTYAGERYFDALRPMLVRFPGIGAAVHAKMREGHRLLSATLVLEWAKTEGASPERGRHGWGAEQDYAAKPGEWSVLVRAVLRPWDTTDRALAPTAAAFVNGRAYWERVCGRAEGTDRSRTVLGPTPLHHASPVARIDVTSLLTSPELGKTLGQRLRALEERGLQVLKRELFDPRYNGQDGHWFDVYSWRPGIGYMRIWVKPPKLVMTLGVDAGAADVAGRLPAALDFGELIKGLQTRPQGRAPVVRPADWAERRRAHTERPAAMPNWQWKRVQELREISGHDLGGLDAGAFLAEDDETYWKGCRRLLTEYPRWWAGHLTTNRILLPLAYGDVLPEPLHEHLRTYWTAWLHPDIADVENPRLRGYFRQYSWSLGTQNFNTNAVAGCYLGGEYLGSENVLRDGRWGVENVMLRNWGFYNGANQEVGDTYYQALSVAGLQMVARFAQDPLYRLMGRIASERQVEQLIAMYNPGLRRMTHPMGRGEMKYQCLFQDGPYHALHTLSRSGVLMDMDAGVRGSKYGISVFGNEGPPGRMAALMPWAPGHWANMVDDKPLPWSAKARWWHLDADEGPAEWHINYLTRNYTLSSRSEDGQPVTTATAQWRRSGDQVSHMEELSTLQLGYGTNGWVFQSIGPYATIQHNNKLLAMKPLPLRQWLRTPPNPDYAGGWRAKQLKDLDCFALHSSIAIMTFGDVTDREVWVNDQRIDQLSGASSPPVTDPKYAFEKNLRTTGKNSVFAKNGDLILIRDGVTYVALIPLCANPLARDQEVELAYEWPVLYVHSFIYRGGAALDLDQYFNAPRKATAGFVVELGARDEHESFEKFRQHLNAARLSLTWNADRECNDIAYASGPDALRMNFRPGTKAEWNRPSAGQLLERRVNGQWPYLPRGIQRDTPWSVQGSTGRLEKNGAVLESEPGHRTYLLCEPTSGVVTAYNPMPDPIWLRLRTPQGATLRADGRLGLARIEVEPANRRVTIEHRLKPAQRKRADLARVIALGGFANEPQVTLNGERAALRAIKLGGQDGYAVGLSGKRPSEREAQAWLPEGDVRWQRARASNAPATYFRDWYAVGPFPAGSYAQEFFHLRNFGPEQGVNLTAAYKGLAAGEKGPVKAEVRWRPALPEGQPAVSAQPLDLRQVFAPAQAVIGYLTATVVSDVERRVQILAGSDERLAVWVNGERVIFRRGHRLCYRDQDRAFVTLKPGRNALLLKQSHGYEAWRLYFRIADEYGLPIKDGLWYEGAHGRAAADGSREASGKE